MKKSIKSFMCSLCSISVALTLSACTMTLPGCNLSVNFQKLAEPELFKGTYVTVEKKAVEDFVKELVGEETGEEGVAPVSTTETQNQDLLQEILLNNQGVTRQAYAHAIFKLGEALDVGGMQNTAEINILKDETGEVPTYKGKYVEKEKTGGVLDLLTEFIEEETGESLDLSNSERTKYDDGEYVYVDGGLGAKKKSESKGSFSFLKNSLNDSSLLGTGLEYLQLADAVGNKGVEYSIKSWEMDTSNTTYVKIKAILEDEMEEDGGTLSATGTQTWVYNKTTKQCVAYSISIDATGKQAIEDLGEVEMSIALVDFAMAWEGAIQLPNDLDSYTEISEGGLQA